MNRLGSILLDLNQGGLPLNIAILHCINKLIQNGWEIRGFNIIKTLSLSIELLIFIKKFLKFHGDCFNFQYLL